MIIVLPHVSGLNDVFEEVVILLTVKDKQEKKGISPSWYNSCTGILEFPQWAEG